MPQRYRRIHDLTARAPNQLIVTPETSVSWFKRFIHAFITAVVASHCP